MNGAHYASIDDMPADVRAQYERALAALAASGPFRHMSLGSSDDRRFWLPWRVIGWLIIGALALFYFVTRSHRP